MVAPVRTTANEYLTRAVDAAVRQMVHASHRSEGSYVRTPLLYPSGSTVVVRVAGSGDDFSVTDFGLGFMEAEGMGLEKVYVRHAEEIASEYGVSYEDHAFKLTRISGEQLTGAVIAIANCSLEVAATA